MGKDSPSPPDPSDLVKAQIKANRITQFTPQGNLLFGKVDANGNFVPDTSGKGAASQVQETPFQKKLRESQEKSSLGLTNSLSNNVGRMSTVPIGFEHLPDYQSAVDWSRVGGVPGAGSAYSAPGVGQAVDAPDSSEYVNGPARDFAKQGNQLEQATYQRGMNLISPDIERQRSQLAQRLADQGLDLGSEAATDEMNRFETGVGNQRENLALSSIGAGRQEQGRLFGQELQGAQFGQSEEGRQFAERAAQAGFSADEAQRMWQDQLSGAGFGAQEQQRIYGNQMQGRQVREQDQLTQMGLTNQARATGRQERQGLRGQLLQELAASLGQQYNPTAGANFTPPGQVDVVGPAMSAYQGQQANYQNQQNQLYGGLFGLGSAALGVPGLFG